MNGRTVQTPYVPYDAFERLSPKGKTVNKSGKQSVLRDLLSVSSLDEAVRMFGFILKKPFTSQG